MSQEFKVGMVVRVKDPEVYTREFAKKIADRDAVVAIIGSRSVLVKFLKRNGRGKEFHERMNVRDLVIKQEAAQ